MVFVLLNRTRLILSLCFVGYWLFLYHILILVHLDLGNC